MATRYHQRSAAGAAALLVLLALAPIAIIDLSETAIWVDVALAGTAVALFLVAFSWIMTVAVPKSLGLRLALSVVVLFLLVFTAALISLWWVTRGTGRLFPE